MYKFVRSIVRSFACSFDRFSFLPFLRSSSSSSFYCCYWLWCWLVVVIIVLYHFIPCYTVYNSIGCSCSSQKGMKKKQQKWKEEVKPPSSSSSSRNIFIYIRILLRSLGSDAGHMNTYLRRRRDPSILLHRQVNTHTHIYTDTDHYAVVKFFFFYLCACVCVRSDQASVYVCDAFIQPQYWYFNIKSNKKRKTKE